MGGDGVVLLDGTQLAARRAPLLRADAAAVRARRGRPPRLLILAFAESDGRVRHVRPKLRACSDAGVEAVPLMLPHQTGTAQAVAALTTAAAREPYDAAFLQFPFPADVHGSTLAAALPPHLDVDVLTPAAVASYFADVNAAPPATVAAGLLLLDEWKIDVRGRDGVVIAHESSFALMFHDAFVRRGARMRPLVLPHQLDAESLRGASLVIAAAAVPRLVDARQIDAGAIAIDAGYFNPGGVGDIDVGSGCDHLRALAPVPGGIGPMTISTLVERVIEFAQRRP